MFNPQRKSKISDIFMQEKIYGLHLRKIGHIENSESLRSKRYQEEAQQQHYLDRLSKSKRQVQERLSGNLRAENYRLMRKLQDTDNRKEQHLEKRQRKHFNSYYTNKKEQERIYQQNVTMVMRMHDLSSEVPSKKQLKKQYKRNKSLRKNAEKLPKILKKEEEFKKKISQPLLQSRTLIYKTMSKK